MFIATGQLKCNGEIATIGYDNGLLTGDKGLIYLAKATAEGWEKEGRLVGPEEGPYIRHGLMQDEIAAGIVIASLFVPYTIRVEGTPRVRPMVEGV